MSSEVIRHFESGVYHAITKPVPAACGHYLHCGHCGQCLNCNSAHTSLACTADCVCRMQREDVIATEIKASRWGRVDA